MDQLVMYPVAFVLTVQPWLLIWVLATSFFVTVSIIAVWSRGKTVREVIKRALITYPIVAALGAIAVTIATGWSVAEVETIRVVPHEVDY